MEAKIKVGEREFTVGEARELYEALKAVFFPSLETTGYIKYSGNVLCDREQVASNLKGTKAYSFPFGAS